jgi:arylsulfotransferase ASST
MSKRGDQAGLRWASRLALALVAATALAVVAWPAGPRAEAAVPSDQVSVPVGGSAIAGITTAPSMTPQFSTTTSDYVMYCGSGANAVTLNLSATSGGTIQAGGQSGASVSLSVMLGEGQAVVVRQGSGGSAVEYWIRCLPHDFPQLVITNGASPPPAGWYLTGNISTSTDGKSGLYAMVLDRNGTPVWYQAAPGGAINVELLPGNNLAWAPSLGPGIGTDPNGAFSLYQLDTQTQSSVRAAANPPAPIDPHELLQMSNGHRMVIATPITIRDLSQYPNLSAANNRIVDCWIEELDSQGGLAWLWKASDHIGVAESTRPQLVDYQGAKAADVYHCNSIDVQTPTGPVLLSVRHTDSVYLIDKSNGHTIWKMGGGNSSHEVGSQLLTITNDPQTAFYAQHDARFQSATEVSLYDNHSPPRTGQARGVQYAIDTVAGTARMDWQYAKTPNAFATGNFRRYTTVADPVNQPDNLIAWGFRTGSGFDEVDASGNLMMRMTMPHGEFEYRVVKVGPSALDLNLLRSTAGLPRPVSPTTGWQSLGGVLTSKPGAASWAPDRLDAFVRGSDQQMWHTFFTGGQWGGWEPLGGVLTTGPAAVSWGSGRLDVFVRGTDQQLWHKWWDGIQWGGWEPLGGVLTSGSAVASWSAGRLDVVAEGQDQQVWHSSYDGVQWNAWEPLGGQTSTEPAAASWAPGRLDLFVRNLDGTLGHRFYAGQWSSWEWYAGSLSSGPSATSAYAGQVDVVAAGSNNVPQRFEWVSRWQNWQSLGGATQQAPALVRRDPNTEEVFVMGTDNLLYHTALFSAPGSARTRRPPPAPSRADAERL